MIINFIMNINKGVFILWGKTALFLLLIFLILILIPVLLVNGLFWQNDSQELLLKVYNHNTNKMVTMELEEYLRGVLAAEMPAIYHMEALKAQAVAARTYTLKQLPRFGGLGSQKYQGADLSTDFTDCQAYLSETEMKDKWGFISFFYYWARINRAVEETKGQVLLYNGQFIDAVYHANSGGMTEDAEYVWGWDTPYLKSIESPYDSENEKSYKSVLNFSMDELKKVFILDDDKDYRDSIVEVSKTSPSGRVLEFRIGNRAFSGFELREKLFLPSSKFNISVDGDIYTFTCYGKGHGVGMSQDGANGFAKNGYKYQQILYHYYNNVEMKKIVLQ